MECSGCGNGATDVVRRNQDVVRLSPRSDLSRFEYAATVAEVGLQDVRGVELDDLAELVARIRPLSGRHRDVDRARHLGERRDVLRRNRLLYPAGPEWLELVRDLDRLAGSEATVHLDEEVGVRADRVANGLYEGYRQPPLLWLELVPAGSEGIELERLVAVSITRVAAAWNSSGVRSTLYQPFA